MSSILTSVKQALGLVEEYTVFDAEIVLYINTAFATLNQLGVGPEDGFQISDKAATWDQFLGTDIAKNNVQSFVILSTKLLHDPPATSFAIAAVQKQIEELTWRISVKREAESWTDPTVTST